MSQNGKLMPSLDHQSTKILNLRVLQRFDPYVEEILITAPHVTFYEFNIELNQWSRKDIEGSLFVVKRNMQPRFQFIVMNRRNTENLVENILGDFEYEIQPPYLLYRNTTQEVNGIWFYNQQDCEAVANLFSRILNAFSKVPPKAKLSSAKSEFEELETVPNLSVMDGPLEAPASTDRVPNIHLHDDSFVNFFGAAMNIGSASNATVAEPRHQLATILSSSNLSGAVPSPLTPFQPTPLPSLSTPSTPSETIGCSTNLVKPTLFTLTPSSSTSLMSPISSYMPTAPLQPQHSYGAPLLQPFPPPAPSASLTPIPYYGPVITRDKVRDALLRLVQNDHFIDMVYREIMNTNYP